MQEDGTHLGLVLSYFGIMQKDAARAVGVDPAMVTRWKRGTERLSADSPRMRPLVDCILSPDRRLEEADLRWLRSRFAEAGISTQLANANELRNALATYLANDGSSVGKKVLDQQRFFAQKVFAVQGLPSIMELVDSELALVPEGRSFLLLASGIGVEQQTAFHDAIVRTLVRGVRMRLLIQAGDDEESGELIRQYFTELTHPHVRVRTFGAQAPYRLRTGMQTTLLIPGRICVQVTGNAEGAPFIACVVRETGFVAAAETELNAAWGEASDMFEDQHDTTPRVVSGRIQRFFASNNDLRVATDGINPLFMSPASFDQLLWRRGIGDSERTWRVEAFAREHDAIERHLAEGGSYKEMTSAFGSLGTADQPLVATYGQTFFDATAVDIPTAIDILEGYLRFATLYPRFEIRFANTCRQMAPGLWMMSTSSLPPEIQIHDGATSCGLVMWQRSLGMSRQLVSLDESLLRAATDCFDDAWSHMRYRVWHDGHLFTNDQSGAADPSASIHFIRMKIEELQQLESERGNV